MEKFIYFDCECKNDPSQVGWKNYKAQGLSVAVIGYEKKASVIDSSDGDELDENAKEVQHLFPEGMDLQFLAIEDPKKAFKYLQKFVQEGYKIVGYNTKLYDNNLIAELAGELNPKEYMNVPIGGNKGETTWGDVEMGYINFLIEKKAGQWNIAEVIKAYRNGDITDDSINEGIKYSNQIKEFLDENSYDIMWEMQQVTGGKWVSPFNLVCSMTIGHGKSDDGAEVPKMYKNGEIERIIKYCKHDVRLSWLLHKFILKYKYVLMPQFKDMPNLTPHHSIKVPFDGSVKNISGEYVHNTALQ